MGNALIKEEGGRRRAYPLTIIRIDTHLGPGRVRYLTSDGYVGVQLEGETRVDEFSIYRLAGVS